VGWYLAISPPAGNAATRAKEHRMKTQHKKAALNRLKTVRGHVEAVIAMIEEERYCPEVMKQVSALEASLERVNRILLQNHLETCVPRAIAEDRGEQIVAELMETLKYTSALTGSAPGLLEPGS
jgi:DNA-binding FrmR family transcriptional regulator